MPTTTQRGYGAGHQQTRAQYQKAMDCGETFRCSCARPDCTGHDGQCQTLIAAGMQWDLGHTDDRRNWTGPECIPCNRAAGARNSNRVRADWSIDW